MEDYLVEELAKLFTPQNTSNISTSPWAQLFNAALNQSSQSNEQPIPAKPKAFDPLQKNNKQDKQNTNNTFTSTTSSPTQKSSTMIPCDIVCKSDAVYVYLDIPGVQKENIQLHVNGDNILSITVERAPDNETAAHNFILSEIKVGTLKRIVKLPKNVDRNSVSAKYENGVLRLKFGVLGTNIDITRILID